MAQPVGRECRGGAVGDSMDKGAAAGGTFGKGPAAGLPSDPDLA